MDKKINYEIDIFDGLTQYNTILNWFADMDNNVKRLILNINKKMTKTMKGKCQKGQEFEIEADKMSVSLYSYDDGLELEAETDKGNYMLDISPFSQEDIDEMEEEDANGNLKDGSFNSHEYEIASLEVTDYKNDAEYEYALTLHKIDGKIYLFLQRGDVDQNVVYVQDDKIVKRCIQEELEEYFDSFKTSL